ncbi:MAG: BatD family protein [Mariprofundales bacterium]
MVRRSWLWLIVILLWGSVANASVLASLDRTTVAEGESVQLTLSVEGEDGDPDLAPLQRDFDVLSRSQSSQFSFMNGHGSSKKSWTLTLMPRRSGVVTIPSIAVGKGRSNTLRLTVTAAGSAPSPGSAVARQDRNIFIEAAITPEKGRVQQQLIYTVKLFRAVNLTQAQLSEPKVEHAVVVNLGNDRNYETVRNGRRFVVTERKYAIFPQQRGTLTIAPLRFDGQVMGGRSMFDPFNRMGQVVRRFSNPVTVEVAGVPSVWHGGSWLPATALTLTQTLSDGPYKVGEPITRKLVLRATGLTAAQLAPILDGVLPDGLKRYPDQPQTSDSKAAAGVVGVRSEKVAVIPLHGGSFILPGVDIAWWNTATGKIEVASVAPRTIRVEGAAPAPVTTTTQPAPHAATPPFQGATQGATQTATQDQHTVLIWWQVAVLILLLLWLATLAMWWRACRATNVAGKAGGEHPAPQRGSDQQLRQQIRAACREAEGARLVQLLSQWAQGLRQEGVVVEQRFPQLVATIDALHRHRYGGGEAMNYGALQQQFDLACSELDTPAPSSVLSIPPLYRD